MSDDFFVEYRCRDKATVCSVTFFFSMAQDTPTKQTRQAIIQLYDASSQRKQQLNFSFIWKHSIGQ